MPFRRRRRYYPWTYWFAVVMVGVFGVMAADVLHVGFGVPYLESSALYAAALTAVFVIWLHTERTLSIHSIDTARCEGFYWAAVWATFAIGTAVGDLSAVTRHLGYFGSMLLYAVLITVPAVGYRWWGWNPILAFWLAYVLTGRWARIAGRLARPTRQCPCLGVGDGAVSAVLAVLIAAAVAYLAVTGRGVQSDRTAAPSPAADRGGSRW